MHIGKLVLTPNAVEKALHQRALVLATNHQKAEYDLLEILGRIDEKKVFRAYGYASLFQYATSALKLSEASAYNFITVARKAREIPEINQAVRSGRLSVATLRKITPVLNATNAAHWFEKAKTLPRILLEKEVAKTHPQIFTPEKARYVSATRIALQVGVNEALFQKLNRVKDLLSQQARRPVTTEQALEELTQFFLEKKDPIKRAARVLQRHRSTTIAPNQPLPVQVAPTHRAIPSTIRHHIVMRDQHRCTFVDGQGKRCTQTRWLDIHHKIPRREGGSHALENLQTLCFHHHQFVHEKKGRDHSRPVQTLQQSST